jgi:hypothetical protein
MRANSYFADCDPHFWANVRIIGQELGYTERNRGLIKTYSVDEMLTSMSDIGLQTRHLVNARGRPTALAATLCKYFEYRARVLNRKVEPLLMSKTQAKEEFSRLKRTLRPTCPLPKNKQKGAKKGPAYFTCIINMLIEASVGANHVEYDPRSLTIFTRNGNPVLTSSRQIDGLLPNLINPITIWEIKEYYNTTTFGSRVADAIYETSLDGLELKELREREHIQVRHYLMIDGHDTWWELGKSYLCRIIDILNMGFVDEVLFGREVIERLPSIVRGWRRLPRRP